MIRRFFDTKAAREDAAIAAAEAERWKNRCAELAAATGKSYERLFYGLWMSAEEELSALKEKAE